MVRFLLSVLVSLIAAALAFLFCMWMIGGFSVSVGGFFIAVVIFTVFQSVLSPLLLKAARKYAPAIVGGIGLIATILSLWLTSLVAGAVTVSGGAGTWITAAVIIWLVSIVVTWILDFAVLQQWWDKRQPA